MSYILEGLKKLEQKRQQEEKSPHLLTFQVNSTEKPAKPSLWFYILIAVLLLNAGVIIWWIHSWRSIGPNTPLAQSALRKSGPTVAKTIPVEQKKTTGKPAPAKGPQQSTPLPASKETPAPKQTSVGTPVSTPKSKPAADGRIIKLNELPPEIRNSLPDFKMSAHFYSADQQARFARVNDKILHEGETLSEGLKVEEINPGGTVFNYRGYRFQIGINENR